MNHIYRVIFNCSLGVYQCVSELAKSSGKSSGRSATQNRGAGLVLSVLTMSVLGMTAVEAQATVYDNGMTTDIQNYEINNRQDVIKNSGTVVNSDFVFINDAGTLDIRDGGRLNTNTSMTIDSQSGSAATLIVTDDNSSVDSRFLFIANNGTGNVTIDSGGSIVVAEDTYIGFYTGANGSLTVTGKDSSTQNSSIFNTDSLRIGINGGKAEVTIEKDGRVIASGVTRYNGSASSILNFDKGTLQLKSNQTDLFNGFDGNKSTNSINLLAGGGIIDTNGYEVDIANAAVIRGEGSFTKTGSGQLSMKESTNQWTGNTTVNGGTLQIDGNYSVANEKKLAITGNDSKLVVSGTLRVGDGDNVKSSASVDNGGTIEVADDLYVGGLGNSIGKLLVDGENSSVIVDNSLYIGFRNSEGTIKVTNGGSIQSKFATLGNRSASTGNLLVTGEGSQFLPSVILRIGNDGAGVVTVADGGLIKTTRIDIADGENSELTVTGKGSKVIGKSINAGTSKSVARIKIADGGSIETIDFALGQNDKSLGELIVTGNNSQLIVTGELQIGDEGEGNLTLDNNATAKAKAMNIGLQAESKGKLIVDNARFDVSDDSQDPTENMVVGNDGSGELIIRNSGQLNTEYMDIGLLNNGLGKVVVQDVNSILSAEGIIVANLGSGTLEIKDGGTVRSKSMALGGATVSQGKVEVSGLGSKLTIDDDLQVGFRGTAILDINDQGIVETQNVTRNRDAVSSTVNFNDGILTLKSNQTNLFNGFDNNINASRSNSINLLAGGGTIDTQEYDVNVFEAAVIKGEGSFTKTGTGQLSMNTDTKAWGGNTTIKQGILTLNGDYAMRDGEMLTIGLNVADSASQAQPQPINAPTSENGKLVVNGTADISKGRLAIDVSEAVQALGNGNTWKDVVTADKLVGRFANTGNVLDNSLLVSFKDDYSIPNAVNLTMVKATIPPINPQPPVIPPVTQPPVVVPPPVTPPVVVPPIIQDTTFIQAVRNQGNSVDLGIANVLDRAIDNRIATGTNPLADALIKDTVNFNSSQLATAANELQPLLMGATNRIITDTNYIISNAITERSLSTPKSGLWAQLLGSNSNHDEKNGVTSYDADSYGAIVGIDTAVSPNLNLGLALSYIDSDVDSDSSSLNHNMSAKSYQAIGYGSYAVNDATQVNFHAGAGRSNVEGERNLTILTDAIAESNYDVDTLQVGFGFAHRIGSQERNLTPFAQLSYAHAKSESYRETGAGVYNFEVDENKYESLRWTAGIKMTQALSSTLAITGQLAAAIENGDQRSDITASFINNNDNFTTNGQEIGQEIGIAGIGISYKPTTNTTLSANYQGEWRDNFNDQGAKVALNVRF